MAKYLLVSFKTCPWVQRSARATGEANWTASPSLELARYSSVPKEESKTTKLIIYEGVHRVEDQGTHSRLGKRGWVARRLGGELGEHW